jgi:hypothetical protein
VAATAVRVAFSDGRHCAIRRRLGWLADCIWGLAVVAATASHRGAAAAEGSDCISAAKALPVMSTDSRFGLRVERRRWRLLSARRSKREIFQLCSLGHTLNARSGEDSVRVSFSHRQRALRHPPAAELVGRLHMRPLPAAAAQHAGSAASSGSRGSRQTRAASWSGVQPSRGSRQTVAHGRLGRRGTVAQRLPVLSLSLLQTVAQRLPALSLSSRRWLSGF